MNALLETPEIRAMVSPISVEEYHHLGELNENGRRTELLRGIVIEKMPKSPLHFTMVERIRVILSSQVQPGWHVRQEGPMTLPDSEPEPDVAIVRGAAGAFDEAHPATADLAVELAISTLPLDRAKALIYAEAGVQEYWIVCPAQKVVEVHRGPGAEGYAQRIVVAAPEVLECAAVAGVRLDLGALFG